MWRSTGLIFPIWTDPTYLSESAFNTMNLPSSFVIDRQRTGAFAVGGRHQP